MVATASAIFDFLDQNLQFSIERHEIYSDVFTSLRKGIRSIIYGLSEVDEHASQQVLSNLRRHLAEWLTVPVSFDGALLEAVSALGEPDTVERVWGRDIRFAYDAASASAIAIQKIENPVRAQLRDKICMLTSRKLDWRIYCHRRARIHFESIPLGQEIEPGSFLHSVTDYRETSPFDVLIKVGPLRSRGWGSAPDALLSAPRFSKLIQVVWSGCADEEDFGYDPTALSMEGTASSKVSIPVADAKSVPQIVSWARVIVSSGDAPLERGLSGADFDDLRFLQQATHPAEMRRAILMRIGPEDGILYPPHSQVATFDPAPGVKEPIGYRLAGQTLVVGMFVMLPTLREADLGALQAGEGQYSRIWKERIQEEFRYTPDDLLKRLHARGIELRNLRYCVKQWCRPPSTVIHAPQQMRHFEILIDVLGLAHEKPQESQKLRRAWWEYAWAEIVHARGDAIQTGLLEHEILDEELFLVVKDLLPQIRSFALTENIFQIEIPPSRSLRGAIRFLKILAIEEGFCAPDTSLKIICSFDTIDQWRA